MSQICNTFVTQLSHLAAGVWNWSGRGRLQAPQMRSNSPRTREGSDGKYGTNGGGDGQTGIGTLPPAAIYADLSCPAWFVAYLVSAGAAKFTWCPTAIGIGNPSLLFPALQSRGRDGGSILTNNRHRKHKIMTTNEVRTTFPTTRAGGAIKSTPFATASASSRNSTKPQRTAPSQALIAQRAYEIWLSQGQKPGCDQKNWFEAELQLQRA